MFGGVIDLGFFWKYPASQEVKQKKMKGGKKKKEMVITLNQN